MPENVKPFDYNEEERNVLRLGKSFGNMIGTDAWKDYVKILNAQIETREAILRLPLSENSKAFEGMDFVTRAASQETIKGALIGLRLALAIPDLTMKHAADIVAEHSPEDDEDAT